jgi:putative tricarboxylic transport membrane protein
MITYHDDWTMFFRSPISATLMFLALLSLVFPTLKKMVFRSSEQKRHDVKLAEAAAAANSN